MKTFFGYVLNRKKEFFLGLIGASFADLVH